MNNPKISIIIPTYNREETLVDTINSVLEQKFDSFELLVIDQTQKHDKKTAEFFKKYSKNDKRFRYFLVAPPSLPAARNFGLEKASSEIVVYIDDDVILDPGFIKAHWETYQQHDVVTTVGRIKEKGKEPGSLHFFRKTDFGAGNFNYPKLEYVHTVQGCNMSFKKQALKKVGGFDTNYIGNALREESDVSYKLKKLGYKTLYNPEASLLHLFTPTGGCRDKTPQYENYILYRNEFLFFLRHRPLKNFPYFFGARLIKFALNKDLLTDGRLHHRLYAFTKGILSGFFVYIFPKKQIISEEISV